MFCQGLPISNRRHHQPFPYPLGEYFPEIKPRFNVDWLDNPINTSSRIPGGIMSRQHKDNRGMKVKKPEPSRLCMLLGVNDDWLDGVFDDNERPLIVEVGYSEGCFPELDNIIIMAKQYPNKNFIGIGICRNEELSREIEEKELRNVKLIKGSDREVFTRQAKVNSDIINEIFLIAPGASSIFLLDKITIEAITKLLKDGGLIKLALEDTEQECYKLDLPLEHPDSLIGFFKGLGIILEQESHFQEKQLFECYSPRYLRFLVHYYVFKKQVSSSLMLRHQNFSNPTAEEKAVYEKALEKLRSMLEGF